jgi:hypothetical protein
VRFESMNQVGNLFGILGRIRCLIAVRHDRGRSKGASRSR